MTDPQACPAGTSMNSRHMAGLPRGQIGPESCDPLLREKTLLFQVYDYLYTFPETICAIPHRDCLGQYKYSCCPFALLHTYVPESPRMFWSTGGATNPSAGATNPSACETKNRPKQSQTATLITVNPELN